MEKPERISRRRLLCGATAAAFVGPCIMTSSARAAKGRPAPNDMIALGCIGLGGRGNALMGSFLKVGLDDTRTVAVCDVNEKNRLDAKGRVEKFYADNLAKGAFRGCDAYNDFRDLLARSDIDAVVIATPDHWHVPIGIAAAKAGKDTYIEKPLGKSVEQGRALCNAVKENKRIFQFGTQQRSDRRFRLASEIARNGKIGKLVTIKVGSPFSGREAAQPTMPVPAGLDYALWLGPAPQKPYDEKRSKTPWWYFISDYALGFIAGWGIHHVDIAQWGNGTDLTGPIEVAGCGDFPPPGEMCDTATGWMVACKYANGVTLIYADEKKIRHGITFEGTDGWVFVDRQRIEAEPESLLKWEPGPNDIRLYRSDDHSRNFLDCIRSRKETICPVEVAHRSDTICHLSDIAIRVGFKLQWDPDKERFIGKDEATGKANEMLSKPVRAPWHL